jgi:hypothetical protein
MEKTGRFPQTSAAESKPDRPRYRWHVFAWAALVLAGTLLFAESYQRWGHPIIDLGRDLYLPAQILHGRVLYRELLYNYGPVVPYLLAGLVAVLGDKLWVFEAFGLATGAACLLALYGIGVRLCGWAVGFASALFFLVFSFFANSTWGCNFVLPYTFSATLGTAFALWSFYFLLRYLYAGRSHPSLAWSVVFLFGAVFTKQEIGLAIGVVHAIAWWAHGVSRRTIAAIVGVGIAFGALFLAAFAARGPAEHALLRENIFRFAGGAGQPFFQLVAGADRPLAHAVGTLASFLQVVAIALAAGVIGILPSSLRGKKWMRSVGGIIGVLACAWCIWQWADAGLFRGSLVLALALGAYSLVRDRRDPLLLLSTFVVFSSLRVCLKFDPVWYGFYLVVPAYPFIAYALGTRLVARVPGRRLTACALVAVAAVMLLRFGVSSIRSYRQMTSVLTTPKGVMKDYPVGRAEAIAAFLDYAERHVAQGKPGLVVFPEGVSLNYFADMTNPTAYYLFIPPEITPAIEERIIEELEATRPEYIAITSRNMTEFGFKGFGVDNSLTLARWLLASYVKEHTFEGCGKTCYKIRLLRRRQHGRTR